ncbi:MAG: ATP-binding cassette domain-containing protein [Thiomargarita sp.]|nr:ATP-binding cassette domain-containing protein [Thiomargarita sp.]
MSNHCIFRLKDITKTFRNNEYLRFVEKVSIPQAQFTLITGDSGVGKSTFINLLSLIDQADNNNPDSELQFTPESSQKIDYFQLYRKDSRFWTRLFNEQCAKIRRQYFGFLPQMGYLLNTFSIQENLSLVALLRDAPNNIDTTKEILATVGFDREELDKKINFSTGQLSGGQAQRVALARAIFHYPKVIFVDEPTTYLDKTRMKTAMEVLTNAVFSKHCTVVIVTHEYEQLVNLLCEAKPDLLINKLTLERQAKDSDVHLIYESYEGK